MKEALNMDNCDLEKLSISAGKLQPAFTAQVTDYKMTVESSVHQVTLDLMTSDCGASYTIVSTVLQINLIIYVSNSLSNWTDLK